MGPPLSPAAAHVPRRVHTVRTPCQNDHGLANPNPDPDPDPNPYPDAGDAEPCLVTVVTLAQPHSPHQNNYGLAFAGVRLVDYAPATALATLPAVLTHAYAGSLLSSLLALAEGGGAAMPSSPASTALGGLSALGTGLLLRELARGLAADDGKS